MVEEEKKKPLSSTSSAYKNQKDELSCLSKLNPSLPSEKKGDKWKVKVKPSKGKTQKRKLVLIKNTGPLPPDKCQTMINDLLKKPMEVEPISSIRIMEVEEANAEEGGLIKRKRSKEAN